MKKLFQKLILFTAVGVLLWGCGKTSVQDEMSPYKIAKKYLKDNHLKEGFSTSDGLMRLILISSFSDSDMTKMDVLCDTFKEFSRIMDDNLTESRNALTSKSQFAGFSTETSIVEKANEGTISMRISSTIKKGDKSLYKSVLYENGTKTTSSITVEEMVEILNESGIKYEIIESFKNKQGDNAIISSLTYSPKSSGK